MFSSRLDWNLTPNRLAALIEAKRQAGAPVLDLTESNPTRAGLQYPGAAILEALADARSLVYEPRAAGAWEARSAISAFYAERGVEVPPERVLLTASTSESYSFLFKLLADPGDEVLTPRPSYPLFEFLAALESVRAIPYPLAYHGRWSVDFDALAHTVTPRTRAIVVVNPNNPTGSFLKRDELARLTALAAERKLAIVSDEVFADYTFRPDPARVSTLVGGGDALVFSLNGLSKFAGLPQMKLGWIAMSGVAGEVARARERLELIADTYLSVGTPAQHALPRLLDLGRDVGGRIAARVRGNFETLGEALRSAPACAMLDVEGGWYATLRVPRTHSEEEWTLVLLERDNVLAQPGFFYDFETEAFLILSLLTPPEVFREGVGRLLARIEAV
ncbi:MAG: pyridoxal phosphate-dependent aminotransferase [Bryobacteraceae bacterium]